VDRSRRPEFQGKDREDLAWGIGHWLCVIAAWLGLLLSLAVLALPAFRDHDGGARWVTGSAAAIAATILAWISRSHTSRSDNSGWTPIESCQQRTAT